MIRIYVLENPTTKKIFYVGATKKLLKHRLASHYDKLEEAKRGSINWNKRLRYLKELEPLKPNIIEVAVCEEKDKDTMEIFYIEKYSKEFTLTNQTKGGTGNDTYSLLTQNAKQLKRERVSNALKGIPKPDGFAKNLSEKRMGYNNPQAGKTKHPPIILDSSDFIIIFKNGIESNKHFNNKYTWSNLVLFAKHNAIHNNKHYYKSIFVVEFLPNINKDIKDIVESLLEREGNCYLFNKHTKEITIN
jgi:hypothetical protein